MARGDAAAQEIGHADADCKPQQNCEINMVQLIELFADASSSLFCASSVEKESSILLQDHLEGIVNGCGLVRKIVSPFDHGIGICTDRKIHRGLLGFPKLWKHFFGTSPNGRGFLEESISAPIRRVGQRLS